VSPNNIEFPGILETLYNQNAKPFEYFDRKVYFLLMDTHITPHPDPYSFNQFLKSAKLEPLKISGASYLEKCN
jgi:hypothetical protein